MIETTREAVAEILRYYRAKGRQYIQRFGTNGYLVMGAAMDAVIVTKPIKVRNII